MSFTDETVASKTSTPLAAAAFLKISTWKAEFTSPALKRTPTVLALPVSARKRSSCRAIGPMLETPVTLVPGFSFVFTTLAASKLVTAVATIGMSRVARAIACVAGVETAKMSCAFSERKRAPMFCSVA